MFLKNIITEYLEDLEDYEEAARESLTHWDIDK